MSNKGIEPKFFPHLKFKNKYRFKTMKVVTPEKHNMICTIEDSYSQDKSFK